MCSRLLPRQSTRSPLDNRAHLIANASQAPNLEVIHREMHGISERGRSHVTSESRSSSQTHDTGGEESQKRVRSHRRGNQTHKRRDKSTIQKIKDLDARIDAINTGANASITVHALIRQIEPSFTERIMIVRVSSRFKLPSQLGVYEGKIDPMNHLDSYKNLMLLQGYSDEVM
ncbi:hypothetical protein Acr_11g0007280 [Actinidia rufa]|uniref:Uncharacterized protein n=1 Tax=Actinidia rufa TaxID=165716 RepID=A0A7J0FCK5_9ERIC|nr:hypothetical protein Acr_11g0007280 [Actinidia rufa]